MKKHGHCMGGTTSPTHQCWSSMLRRCNNPKCKDYKNYGGRGIKVCERWHDFRNFLEDMGFRPDGLTLERKNNNKGYESSNCCWATRKEQNSNRRSFSYSPMSCGPNRQYLFIAMNRKGTMVASNNQHEFAGQYGLSVSAISRCLNDKRKYHKGWMFRRVNERDGRDIRVSIK